MKKSGTLHYDYHRERYIVTFDDSTIYPVWLHCGDCLDVLIGKRWLTTSIEMDWKYGWYLTSTEQTDLEGLRVRKEC